MSNSSLVTYRLISPNKTVPRRDRIKKITIHHMAGNLSLQDCGRGFANPKRKASAHYGVDSQGRVGQFVDEKDRAWTSSNGDNDHQAVTIEVANDQIGGNWHVSDKALEATINLCTDICKRNGIKRLNFTGDASGNLTMHRYFAATACPGPYLASKFPYIASEVNGRLMRVETPYDKEKTMDGKEIYQKLIQYLEKQPAPEWAKDELAEAVKLGITDGETPMELMPRYQAAIMALRAVKAVKK